MTVCGHGVQEENVTEGPPGGWIQEDKRTLVCRQQSVLQTPGKQTPRGTRRGKARICGFFALFPSNSVHGLIEPCCISP